MLAKYQKLSGKEINYMLKRWKRVYGKLFTFWSIPQYKNNSFHQWWIQIPNKVAKHATMRHFLKRKGYKSIKSYQESLWKKYYKTFIVVNKKHAWALKEVIEIGDKEKIGVFREESFKNDVDFFMKKIKNQ